MIYKEIWFWLIIIGIVIAVSGIFITFFTSANQTLGIIVIVLGVLLLIGGIIFAFVKKGGRTIDIGESDVRLRTKFGNSLVDTAKTYNKDVDAFAQDYIANDFNTYIRNYAKSAGKLTGSSVFI